jgi:CO dehydrogenase maturation factor
MAKIIALAGKGGTGKTTMGGLLIKYLVKTGKTPVLAVDADPNTNLNEVLGLKVDETLGEAREEMKTGVSAGMTKDIFMEMKIQEAVVESDGFDLIVMGRPEGSGCYCAANTLLTQFLDKLVSNYNYTVVDNEAGMEHISRLTTGNVDLLLIVSDPSRRGIQAAARILELTKELKLQIGKVAVIVNMAKDGQEEAIEKAFEPYEMELAGIVPEDKNIQQFDLEGRPTVELEEGSVAVKHAYPIFKDILEK